MLTAAQDIVIPLPMNASAVSQNTLRQSQKSTLLHISDLALASSEKRLEILGENLFPLVAQHEPVHAGKVTRMLLEMDQAEILHLLETPETLKSKIVEALDVLKIPTKSLAMSNVDDQFSITSMK